MYRHVANPVWLVLACTVALPSNAQPPSLSKAEILDAVEGHYESIRDLNVSFTFDALRATPNNPHYRYRANVVTKGSMIQVDCTYGPDLAFRNRTFRRIVAFNGARTTTFEVHLGLAQVQTMLSSEASTNVLGFFDLMMLNPPNDGQGYGDTSLISLLRSENSELRPTLEEIHGRSCAVIDFRNPGDGNILMTVWLDTDRGFLPIRRTVRPQQRPDFVHMEFNVEDAEEVVPGLWFATLGTKKVNSLGTGRDIDVDLEFLLNVERDANGAALIRVNQDVPDAYFDLWRNVPGGTEVIDRDTNEKWIASAGTGLGALLDGLYATLVS